MCVCAKHKAVACVWGILIFSGMLSGYYDVLFDEDQNILSLTLAGFGNLIVNTLKVFFGFVRQNFNPLVCFRNLR